MPFNSIDKTRPVLIVDDSPMYRTAAKGMLQKLGYDGEKLHFAQDAKEALQRCRQHSYGLIFFDYNLGDKANGFQLIDELQDKKLLAADCVNIIVTGDATADVVRGFMELDPDGYLLKPLNYSTLKERLPGFMRKKRHLSDVMVAFDKKQYDSVITLVDENFYTEDDIIVRSQLIKANALIELDRLDEARNVLINLKGSGENGRVMLALGQIALKQRQYKQGLFLLKPLKKDTFLSAAAGHLSAELNIAQIQFREAIEEIDSSISISPKVIQRHWLKVYLHMALFELPTAIQAVKTMILESRHSFRESVDMYQLGALLLLDQAQFSSHKSRIVHLFAFTKWVESWRANFDRLAYKPMELLLYARGNILKSNLSKARECLSEYNQLIAQLENHTPSLFEQIELSRVTLLMGDQSEYLRLSESINIKLKREPFTSENKAILAYMSQWRSKSERLHESASKMKKEAIRCIENRNFERASIILAKAIDSQASDPEIAKLLMGVLTRAWPANMGRKEVTSLALRCREQLKGTDFIKSKEFLAQSKILAQQLDFKDLQANTVV